MKIAVLGWGSLIWDPRSLAIEDSFSEDGPELPLEFSRISANGRLTLVIDPSNGSSRKTLVAKSSLEDLAAAVENMRVREGTNKAGIGWADVTKQTISVTARERHPTAAAQILSWATANEWDAVVWTALGSNFSQKRAGVVYTPLNAMAYIRSLSGETLANAEEYIVNAPASIDTPFRRLHSVESRPERN